ncbi:MAG: hypothetical protein JNL82_22835 [Myxococcales bacterium]|nr:hypothetical protein [Myxococcales bacterium]
MGKDSRRGGSFILSAMPFLLTGLISQLIAGKPDIQAVPAVNLEPSAGASFCDVDSHVRLGISRTLTHKQLTRLHRMMQVRIQLTMDRVSETTWQLRVLLNAPGVRGKSWRLVAPTCERVAERAGTKLGFILRAIFGRTNIRPPPPHRPEPLGITDDQEAPVVDVLPPIQTPSILWRGYRDMTNMSAPIQTPTRTGETRVDPPACDASAPLEPAYQYTEEELPAVLAARPPVSSRERAPDGNIYLRVDARAVHGTLPQPMAGGVELRLAEQAGRVRLEFGLALDYAGQNSFPVLLPVHQSGRLSARISVCGEVMERTRLSVRVCGGIDGGMIFIKLVQRSARPVSSYILFGPSLTWWFSKHAGLWVGLHGGPALTRLRFQFGYPVFEKLTLPPVALEGAIGIELRWPTSGHRKESRG